MNSIESSPTDDRLRITEIFLSLQGESLTVGCPTVFVRLTGCPLRCGYCDTSYAFQGGELFTLGQILEQVAAGSPEAIERILVPAPAGTQIPLVQLADIEYVRGPQVIKSEDTFLVGYVLFDKRDGFAEVEVVASGSPHGTLALPDGAVVFRPGMTMEDMEKAAIQAALESVDGNRRKAARILGIHEATVRTKLKRYSISLEGGLAS